MDPRPALPAAATLARRAPLAADTGELPAPLDAARLAALGRQAPQPLAGLLAGRLAACVEAGGDGPQLFDCRDQWPDPHVPPLQEHLLLVALAAGEPVLGWLPGQTPQARPLGPGQLWLLPAGEPAYLQLPARHHLLLLALRPRLLYGRAAAGSSPPPGRLRACAGVADAVVEGIARALWAAAPQGAAGRELAQHLGRALASHLRTHHAEAAAPERAGLGQLRLRRVLDHLHARLDQPMNLAEAARVAGCSVSHFAHLFKASMGAPPMRYLREQRMLCARELVETTGLSMCEIALRVGIPEPAQFSQAFRAHWHTAPSSLRRAG